VAQVPPRFPEPEGDAREALIERGLPPYNAYFTCLSSARIKLTLSTTFSVPPTPWSQDRPVLGASALTSVTPLRVNGPVPNCPFVCQKQAFCVSPLWFHLSLT
jgi:hypothetical protein